MTRWWLGLAGGLALAACGSDPAPSEPGPPSPAEQCLIDGGHWTAPHTSTNFTVETDAGPVVVSVHNSSDAYACLFPPVIVTH